MRGLLGDEKTIKAAGKVVDAAQDRRQNQENGVIIKLCGDRPKKPSKKLRTRWLAKPKMPRRISSTVHQFKL